MLDIKINIPKSIQNIDKALKVDMKIALYNSCYEVERKAKAYAPYKAGNLRRSINTKIDENNLTGEVGTNIVYAPIQEYGGVIRAKKKKYLTFKIGGKWIRTKQVKIKAKKYMKKAIDNSRYNINENFKKLLQSYK